MCIIHKPIHCRIYRGREKEGEAKILKALNHFSFHYPPSPGQERSRSRVSFDFWPEESPSREKPFFSLEGDSSGQKSKLTRLLDLSCPGDGGSEKRNDFKPSKF